MNCEGLDGCSDASRHDDVLSSAFLRLHNVRESLKRKGLLHGEAGHASAAAAPAPAPANVHLGPVLEADTTHRHVSWILARKNSRKPNKQPRRSLDLNSSFVQVEMLSSKDIENFLLEGINQS